jgi:DNA (cytosine-5)-methyltransferase 1
LANAKRDAGHEGGCRLGGNSAPRISGQANWFGASQPSIFPPGPSDSAAWSDVLTSSSHLAPAYSRHDLAAAALSFAAILDPDTAARHEQRARQVAGGSILATLGEEAFCMVEHEKAFTAFRQLADGLAHRARAIKLLGNGVVPLAAGYAFRTLAAAHGLRPVDMEAASGTDATEATGAVVTA